MLFAMLFTILFTREAMESAMATVATARAMGDAATPKQVGDQDDVFGLGFSSSYFCF